MCCCCCVCMTRRLALEVWKIRPQVLRDPAAVSRQARLLLLDPSDWWVGLLLWVAGGDVLRFDCIAEWLQAFSLIFVFIAFMLSVEPVSVADAPKSLGSPLGSQSPGRHLWCQSSHQSTIGVLLPILDRREVNVHLSPPITTMRTDWRLNESFKAFNKQMDD